MESSYETLVSLKVLGQPEEEVELGAEMVGDSVEEGTHLADGAMVKQKMLYKQEGPAGLPSTFSSATEQQAFFGAEQAVFWNSPGDFALLESGPLALRRRIAPALSSLAEHRG